MPNSFPPSNPLNTIAGKSLNISFLFPRQTQAVFTIANLKSDILIRQNLQTGGSFAKVRLHAPELEKMLRLFSTALAPQAKNPFLLTLSGAEMKIEACEGNHAPALIFYGKISHCAGIFKTPDRFLDLEAHSALLYNETACPAFTCQQPVWASQILADLCASQNLTLKKNDFDYLIQPPFALQGTFLQQISQIISPKKGVFILDPIQKTLSAAQKDLTGSQATLVLDPDHFIDFPACAGQMLSLRCLFQPTAHLGQKISVNTKMLEMQDITANSQSALHAPWNGEWILYHFVHRLSSEKKHIRWETHLHAYRLQS